MCVGDMHRDMHRPWLCVWGICIGHGYVCRGAMAIFMHRAALAMCYHDVCVAVTGRKRTLFQCMWANSISYISRMKSVQILCVPL